MTAPPIPSILAWGERWTLLDKQLAYAFSLRTAFEILHPVVGRRVHLKAIAGSSTARSTYHVFGAAVSEGPYGSLQEVPQAYVISGQDWIDLSENGTGTFDGGLVLEQASVGGADASKTSDKLTISYAGKASLQGGFQMCFPIAYGLTQPPEKKSTIKGKAFISARHECADPKYRWMIQQQFVGWGALTATKDSQKWKFQLDVDLYAGQ